VKAQFSAKVKLLRTDQGTDVALFLSSKGIIHEISYTATPRQNGRIERRHKYIIEMARALRFWGDCVLTTLSDKQVVLNCSTPHVVLFGATPNYSHIRVFGCLCYISTSSVNRKKFDPRSYPCVFLGYPFGFMGYKSQKTQITRDVQFVETIFPFSSINPSTQVQTVAPPTHVDDLFHSFQPITRTIVEEGVEANPELLAANSLDYAPTLVPPSFDTVSTSSVSLRRSIRVVKTNNALSFSEPTSIIEALQSSD
ncbi:hypothetical protein V2J09_017083, partial [Rumex salicifolius]